VLELHAQGDGAMIGKFVFIDDYYNTGEVVDKPGDEHYLVRLERRPIMVGVVQPNRDGGDR
jgi:hypothetical protein